MEVEFCHLLEDTLGLFFVGFWVGRGNKKVIHVDDEPSFSDHVSKRVVHEMLECGGGVAEAEEHDGRCKESFVSNEDYLPLVSIFDLNVVIPPMNVEFGEVTSIFQLVYKVGDEGKRVGIMGGMFVEVAVVLARMKFAIHLFDKEEGRCLGGVGRTNLAGGQVFLKKVLSSFLFVGGEWVDFAYLRHE